jgi:ABC-type transport system involved in cytochrome c biogenesis permease component
MFPRLGGAGAIAWRQLTTALRTARAMLIVLVFICIAVGPALYFSGVNRRAENGTDQAIANLLVGAMFWITFMLANMLRFDFRGDLDHIDTLKALPVPRAAIAIAQLIAPIAVLVICQSVLLTSIGIMLHMDWQKLALVMLFALPMDAMLIAVENLIFLIFPVRYVTVSPGDLQGIGRQMLVFLLKGLALLVGAALAGAVGAGAWFASSKSNSSFIVATLIMLIIEFLFMIPLLVIAFTRFDPSVDTPA